MDIVVCTDHNYVMPCGVLLWSLCKNNKSRDIDFNVIIDESVSDSDKTNLNNIAKRSDNIQVHFYELNGHLFDSFPNLGKGIYVTKATYYRLYLSEILPTKVDKVLYLDCDMIVRKDITPLWETNIEHVAAAVVMDGMDGLVQLYNRLGYISDKGYFNAGMLLINLKYWRENDVLGKCLKFIENNYNKIVSHDQDVLNVILQDSKVNVDITYNFGECFLYKVNYMQFDFLKNKNAIDNAIKDPVIVHYTITKPWKDNCTNPFRSLFYKYRDETPWAFTPLEKVKLPFKQSVKLHIKKFLSKLGIIQNVLFTPFRDVPNDLE